MPHWHTYSWTGRERPEDRLRVDKFGEYPPLETAHWLHKPARMVRLTATDPGEVMVWLKEQLSEYPLMETDMPAERKLFWAEEALGRGADVVWGYYTHTAYVSRAAIACGAGSGCPQPV